MLSSCEYRIKSTLEEFRKSVCIPCDESFYDEETCNTLFCMLYGKNVTELIAEDAQYCADSVCETYDYYCERCGLLTDSYTCPECICPECGDTLVELQIKVIE